MRNKRYLTGIDWIVHTLDYTSRKNTGIGNTSQIVVELKAHLKKEVLSSYLEETINSFPVLRGKIKRSWNLAPYWHIYPKKPAFMFNSDQIKEHDRQKVFALLAKQINMPFPGYLSFYLLSTPQKSFLAMSFDHRLFDAKGAEAFLCMLADKNKIHKDIDYTQPSQLNKWKDKFLAGKTVNRRFLSLAEGAPSKSVNNFNKNKRKFSFQLISFDKQTCQKIVNTAYKKAGYLLFMPYVLSLVIYRIHLLFSEHETLGKDYILSVSVDNRNPEQVLKQPFFNHLSFLFFCLSQKTAADQQESLTSIKKQIYQQTKEKFPENFAKASLLMRILPKPLLNKAIKLYFRGTESSLSFSSIGESIFNQKTFMDTEVENVFHTPRVPVPPGAGVFLNQYRGRLNLVFSYVEDLFNQESIEKFLKGLKEDLVNTYE